MTDLATSGTTINIWNPGSAAPTGVPSQPEIAEQRRRALARVGRSIQLDDGSPRSGARPPVRAEVPASKGDSQTAIIRLYDPIDSWGEWWGISAKEFASVLDDLPDTVGEIRLLINSPGGECTEGFAIANLLRNHPARTVAVVEGLAASAASYVAAACDELYVSPNSETMIHNPHGICIGEAGDMRQLADLLDHLAANMATIYAGKAGGTADQWRAVMDAETWFSAQEAVDAGLADGLYEQAPTDPKAQARFDLSIFNFAGRAHAPEPTIPSATQPNATPRPGQEGASNMDVTEIREALGLPDDTSDEDVLSAALDRLTAPPPEPEPVEAALPEGVVAISEAQLNELRNDAQAGREARAQQIQTERNALVDAAVNDGRIAPVERDAWLAKLEAGTGAEQILAALKPGVIPVDQLGLGGSADLDTEFAEYVSIYGKEA